MSLNNLIENIVSGDLNESNVSFKSVLSEKVLEKLEEKKLSRKQKKLDKNHNGKLDSDDFKQIRGEKGHCCSEESDLEESNELVNKIPDGSDRRKTIGLLAMHQQSLSDYKKAKSPIKKSHHLDMAQQHLDNANDILRKHNIIESDLEEKYDDSGAYDQWDPKHPHFVKNYKKWKQTNPDGKLDAFVSHMKNKPTQLPEETDLESQLAEISSELAKGYLSAKTKHFQGELPSTSRQVVIANTNVDKNDPEGANKKINKAYHNINKATGIANNPNYYKSRKYKKTIGSVSDSTEYSQEDLESQLAEVLNPDQGVKAYIDDFQKSDDPRFEGDSKEQRRKRAIAAFYAAKKK